MVFRKALIILVIWLVITLLTNIKLGFCALTDNCTLTYFQNLGLTDTEGLAVTFNSVTIIPPEGGLPEHCRV